MRRKTDRAVRRFGGVELVQCEPRVLLAASVIGDINTLPAQDLNPSEIVTSKGIAYFFKTDTTHGSELWRSDGTFVGTWLVKDIDPGVAQGGGSLSVIPSFAVMADGTIYFNAMNAIGNLELWKSDGTEAGTVQVKDIRPGPLGSSPANITATPGGVFFTADDGTHGRELWFSNGTEAGTYLVKDQRPGSAGQTSRQMAYVNGNLYFEGTDGSSSGLWKSTGAAGNMTLVKADSFLGAGKWTVAFDNRVYVVDFNGQLWTSDGTSAGTGVVQNTSGTVYEFRNVGTSLYFEKSTGLYRINSGSTVPNLITASVPSANLAALGQDLFYTYNNALFRVPAGSSTPSQVANLGSNSNPSNLTAVGSTLYFSTGDSTSGYYLFAQQGAAGVPGSVKKLNDGGLAARPNTFVALGTRLLFSNVDPATSSELWTSDGSAAGTHLLRDIDTATNDSSPFFYTQLGSAVLLQANDGIHGSELWSAGFDGSLTMLADITPGTSPQSPYGAVGVGNVAYFTSGPDSPGGSEPWVTDGTPAGTHVLKEIRTGALSSNASGYTLFNGRVYFSADDGVKGAELWSSDGTTEGTQLFLDIYSGVGASKPGNFRVLNGVMYFTAADSRGIELWVTDGTAQGTRVVKDIAFDSSPNNLVALGNELYFTANDISHGVELWKTDGSDAGTLLVKDIRPGTASSSPGGLTPAGDYLFFAANDGTHGTELWRTDGTANGTVLFSDNAPGSVSSSPLVTAMDDVVFWIANDAAGGKQLWRGGGRTDAGPTLVLQLYNAGAPAGSYGPLTVVRGRLFWQGYDGATPSDLWSSDGTTLGTFPVNDVTSSVDVRLLLPASNGDIYYAGYSPQFGVEPFVVHDTFAPFVADAWFDETTGRTVRIKLSEELGAPGAAQVRVSNVDTGTEVEPAGLGVVYDAQTRTLSVTLNGAADGNYHLSLLPDGLADLSGNAMTDGAGVDFFIMRGDANHDRAVDFNDLVKLAQNYNTAGKSFADGDFNFDGNVDFNDLVILAQRYNTSLPVGGGVVAGAGVSPVALMPAVSGGVATDKKKKVAPPKVFRAPPSKAVVAKKVVRSPFARVRVR
jgi:ELWxxDGT repeat protein